MHEVNEKTLWIDFPLLILNQVFYTYQIQI